MEKFYITTAIDYVNASPHIGHAFEKVIADAIARWHKLSGKDVFFLTGTDENAQKNVQAANQANISVRELVDKNSKLFINLCKKLNIFNNDFIRTSQERHKKIAKQIFKKIYDNGDIYKGKYEGYYCTGCEAFITEKELVDGKCPEHHTKPEWMSEDAYFFKLSKYKDKIIKFIKTYIIPESKKNEILSRLENDELRDLCVSRTNLEWGIDAPVEKGYKIYVWIDALTNYISGSQGNWPANLHVIGKGINWFHSVIWPAILMSAGYSLPDKLLVHGYLNLKGQKISKSLGNTINPLELLEKYKPDTIRYALLRCSVFEDSDFSEEIIINRHNNELANNLGNLVSRTTALAEKYGMQAVENKLIKKLNLKKIEKHIENYELDKALQEIFKFIDVCNEYIQQKKPWETKDKQVLYELLDSIKAITILLYPFLPDTAETIAKHFKFKLAYENIQKPLSPSKIKKISPLFTKVDIKQSDNKINKQPSHKEIMGIKSTNQISFDEWQKLDLRVGQIKKVGDIKGADKLYKLEIDIGETKQVVAGLKPYYKKQELESKKVILFTNLEPKKMKGIKSEGMMLAAVSEAQDKVSLIQPDKDIAIGSKVM
ncbi:MAG: methionine--tRNA ligase [Candidatus Nanoarchaeia archaeon]